MGSRVGVWEHGREERERREGKKKDVDGGRGGGNGEERDSYRVWMGKRKGWVRAGGGNREGYAYYGCGGGALDRTGPATLSHDAHRSDRTHCTFHKSGKCNGSCPFGAFGALG